jgi:hypothetical protein
MRMDLERAKDEKFLNILKGTPGLEHLVDTIDNFFSISHSYEIWIE